MKLNLANGFVGLPIGDRNCPTRDNFVFGKVLKAHNRTAQYLTKRELERNLIFDQ